MAEVQGNYGRLIQGISQQPPAVRLPGQCTFAMNTIPDVVQGLRTRMGGKHIAKLMHSLDLKSNTYHYRRGGGEEEYFIITKPNSLPVVFDNKGRPCVVSVEGQASDYLSMQNPRDRLQALTIGDYTFLLNKDKTVLSAPAKTPGASVTSICYLAFSQYSHRYTIYLDGVSVATYQTLDGSASWHSVDNDTSWVVSKILESLAPEPNELPTSPRLTKIAEFNFVKDDYCIYITPKNATQTYTLSTTDGAKDKDFIAIRDFVTDVGDLPRKAPAGHIVKVAPDGSKPESQYWLKAEATTSGKVSWKESLGLDCFIGFDKATLPHVLIRESIDGNGIAHFKLRQGEWEDRKVGDDETNEFPDFTDATISGMFMVQNRLCFMSGESVTSTRTSRFFDFFRFTVLSELDTDPFSVYSDAADVYAFHGAAVLDGDTVLFSEKNQFILPGDKVITKATALLRPVTTFEVNAKVQPVVTGESIMFCYGVGDVSGVREFFTDSYSDTKKAQPITSHVSRLLDGDVRELVASSNINRLFVLMDKALNYIFVYDWLWQGTEKVQAAWHVWGFPEGSIVHSLKYANDLLYVIAQRNDGVYLEVMDMGDSLEYGLQETILLDRKVELNMHYDGTYWRSQPLPYLSQNMSLCDTVLVNGWPEYVGGAVPFHYDQATNSIYTDFDLADTTVTVKLVFGDTFELRFEPTPPLVKSGQQGDKVSYLDVPLIHNVYLNLDKYPDFTVEVRDTLSGHTRTTTVSPRIGGKPNNRGGYMPPLEGTERIPLRKKSTSCAFTLISRSPHILQLRDIEWTGSYNPSRRRV